MICGQVPFLYVIIVGFVAVGQARPSRSTSRCTAWSTEDHGTPRSAHSRSAVLPHAQQLTLQRWRKNGLHCRAHTSSFTRSIFHTQLCHTHTTTYIHTYVPSYIHTYMHACMHTYIHYITYIHTYIHTYIPFYLLDLSPPPLSFLSPLKPLKLIIGRS